MKFEIISDPVQPRNFLPFITQQMATYHFRNDSFADRGFPFLRFLRPITGVNRGANIGASKGFEKRDSACFSKSRHA